MPEATNWQELAEHYCEVNFSWTHLSPDRAEVSRWHGELAAKYLDKLPANRMRQVALDYLLLAKDAAVRASLEGQP